MTDQPADCLICGRPALPSGDPSCDCLTHSLSRPVHPPHWDPDPADVALFPLPEEKERAPEPIEPGGCPTLRPHPTHRKPRQRTRIAAAAGGAVAAVVGCTALAASLLGQGGRSGEAVHDDVGGPSLAVPDGGATTDPARPPSPEHTGRTHEERPTQTPSATAGSPSPSASSSREPTPERSSSPPVPDRPTTGTGGSTGGTGTNPPPEETPGTDPPEQTTTPTAPQEPPVLSAGDQGPEVRELQERLLQLGWVYAGEVSGFYDEETAAAVERFQIAYGVEGDPPGVYGRNTRQALEEHTTTP